MSYHSYTRVDLNYTIPAFASVVFFLDCDKTDKK